MTYQMKMMDERMAGIREGRQEGWQKALVESIHAVMSSLGCDPNRAMDVLNIPTSEQPMYAALLENQ